MKVWLLIIAVAVFCNPNECRDDMDCDDGCLCVEGYCE